MIPSSSNSPYSPSEIPPESMDIDVPSEPIRKIDEKAQSLAEKWLNGINEEIASQSRPESHEYYLDAKDDTPASEVFMKLVEDLYSEAEEMLESGATAEVVDVPAIMELEWTDERFAWETSHFRELLDNVVEARKATYSHDFRAFVERVAKSLDLRVEDLMPDDSDDIAYIHEAWKKLTDLRSLNDIVQLDLSNLDLHALPPEVADMENLEELILSHNKLLTLPKEIGRLGHLKKLLADNNVLKSVPKELGEITGLIELDLSNNRLERIPDSFGKLVNLQTLDLSVNRLRDIPHQLEELKHLHNLVTYGNKL